MTYIYQLKDHFENYSKQQQQPVSTSKSTSSITKIFHKNKQNTPFKTLLFEDETNKNKTSTPFTTKTGPITPPSILTPSISATTSNKDSLTPIKAKPVDSRKQYMNPFDSDDDDDDSFGGNNKNDESVAHAAIIEIKQNGQVINACNGNEDYNE
jgi:hypothetical protein